MTSLRSRLFHGTAVAALALLPNAAQAAAALPTGGTIQSGTVAATATNATVGGTGAAGDPFATSGIASNGALNLVVGTGTPHQNAIINWDSFEIGSTAGVNNVVNFTGSGGTAFSVLNRVTGGSPTTIAGTINGGANGSIFVINEAGIAFAGSSSVTNLSGFVASSLDIKNSDFTAFATGADTAIRFAPSSLLGTGTGTGAAGISTAAGASIAPDSVLLLVTPKLSSSGALSASGGDAALVLASDATVTLNPTSIISMKIDAGATVATAQTLAGTVGGKHVLVAAASAADLVGSLLGVSGDINATTATATDSGIVIAINRDVSAAGISFTTVDPPHSVPGLSVTGTLMSSARIDTASSGATSIAAATATGGASFTTGAGLKLGGNISAGGDLTATGTSITLGGDGATHGLKTTGTGALTLTASAGGANAITTLGDFTIAGGGAVSLLSAPAVGAKVVQDGSLAVTGSSVLVGDIASAPAGTLAGNGDVMLTANGLAATDSIVAGSVAAQGAVFVTSANGAVTLAGATSGNVGGVAHDVTATSAGVTTITGPVSSAGNIVVSGSSLILGTDGATGALTAGASGTVGLTASGGGAGAITTLGDFTISGGGAVTLKSAPGVGANVSQDGSLAITGSKVFVGNIASNPAVPLAGTGDLVLTAKGTTATDSVVAGSVAAQSAIKVSSAKGTVTLTDATAAGDIVVSGSALTFGTTGTATAVKTTGTTGAITLTASGGGAAAVTTLGRVGFSAPGAITFQKSSGVAANVTQTDSFEADGGSVSVGDIALSSTAAATGDGAVTLTASGPAASGSVAAGNVNALGHVLATSTNAGVTLGGATSGTAGAGDHDVTVTAAAGVATVSGAVISAVDYRVTGASVALTGTQAAARNVLIKSTTGDISLAGSLAADTAAAGDKRLILDSAAAISGGGSLKSGTANDSDILIAAAGDIALGKVDARSLASTGSRPIPAAVSDYSATTANVLTGPGAVALGAVTTANAVTIASSETNPLRLDHSDVTTGIVTSSSGGVTVTSAGGNATVAGATSGGGQAVKVTAAGVATVSGAVTATGDYTVTGASVVLGGAGSVQTAKGDVLIKSTSGNIAAAGSLTADNAGGGSKQLVLDSATSIDAIGGVVLNLESGLAGQSDVVLRVGAGSALTLGTIDANKLSGATLIMAPTGAVSDYVATLNAGMVPELSTSGAISLGAVSTAASNAIGTTGAASSLTIGGDTARDPGSSVELSSTLGDVTVSGPVVAQTFANLHADAGKLTVGSVSAFDGDARLIGKTAIVKAAGAQTIAAPGNIVLASNGEIGVDAVRGGTIAVGGVTGADAGSLTGDSLRAGGAVTVNTSGAITLSGAHATSAESTGFGLDAATLTIFNNGIFGAADVTLASTGAAVTVNDIASTKNIVGSGTTFTLGTAGAPHLLNAAGSVTLTASDTGAAAITVLGKYAITGGGAVALQRSAGGGANVTLDNSLAVTGTSVLVGGTTLAATLPALVGLGDVTLSATGAAATDAVTAGAIAARSAVSATSANGDVTLGGATSGAASDVRVTAAGAATVGGNVTAGGSYFVKGKSVAIGGAGTNQTAIGDVLIQATGGDIVARGTIVSDNGAAPTGTHPLVLDSFGAISGGKDSGGTSLPGANLRAGAVSLTGTRSNVLLRLDTATDLVLGDIDANVFAQTATGGFPATAGGYAAGTVLVTDGAITLGTVRTVASNGIETVGSVGAHPDIVVAGDTSSTGNVSLVSGSGDITVNGSVSALQYVLIAGAGTTRAALVRSATDQVVISGKSGVGASTGGRLTIAAATNATVYSDGDIALGDVRAGGTIDIRGYTPGPAGSLTGGSLEANGAITVNTTGAIDLTAGTTVATHRNLLNPALTAFDGPANALDADVSLTSGGAITAKGLAATGNIALNGGGAVGVTGTVAAGDAMTAGASGNYTVVGGSALIGAAGVSQTATGNVLIRSTATDIAAAGTLTAGGKLVLDSATSIGGIVVPGPLATAKLVAGTDVLLRTGTGGAIVLGDINGDRLATAVTMAAPPTTVADYTAKLDGTVATLSTDGAITLGAVMTVQANEIVSTGTASGQRDVKVGSDTTTGALSGIDVGSKSGAVTISGPVISKAGVNLHADFTGPIFDPPQGALSFGNVTARGGDATLTGGKSVTASTATTIAATGNIVLGSPGAVAIGSAQAGGTITVQGLTGGSAGSLSAVGLQANGAVTATTTGAINLSGTGAAATATQRKAFSITTGFTGGNVLTDANVSLTSNGGTVTVADLASTGNIVLSASGLAKATGTVTAGDASTKAASGNYTVTGADITLGGGGAIGQSATGSILLNASGAIKVDTLRAGGAITTAGLTVLTTPVSFDGVALQANGAIAVTTSGAISLTGIGTGATATSGAGANVSLTSIGGTVTVADLASTGNIALSAIGLATASGKVTATGTYTVTGGSIVLGGGIVGQAALGDILLQSPGAITLTALRSGGTITARGPTSADSAASLIGDSLQANGAISVKTSGVITLAGVNATSIATQRKLIDADLGGFNRPATTPYDANIALTTTGGAISVNGGSSTGGTTLTTAATGTITATGTLTAGDTSTVTPLADLILAAGGDASLTNGTATRNVSVTSTNGDATIGTATAGTNTAVGGSITAKSLATGGHATITSGTATGGNVLADGDKSATITSGTTNGAGLIGDVKATSAAGTATVTTGRARGTVTADALTAALVGDAIADNGDVTAISRSTTDGSATITLAKGRNVTADGQFGAATVVNGKSLVAGDITATVHSGTNLASIGTATATSGNIVATQAGSGNATIGTASAIGTGGNVTATAGGLADITVSGIGTGSVTATGATAHIAFGHATGATASNVRAVATTGTATIDLATADTGNVDALAATGATITSGTATLGNVRAKSTGGGLATITTGVAGASIVATGGSVLIGTATAGDDIIASAGSGSVTATTLTITGLGADVAATDASGTPLTGALTGLGGSNAVIRASNAATIGGVVSIAQANAAKTANYDVMAAALTLGTAGVALDQAAAGRVDLVANTVTFLNTGGTLQSNVGGKRIANALADALTAGGGLSITAANGIDGATTNLVANTKMLAVTPFVDLQARQPGVTLVEAATGVQPVQVASITGGAVTVSAPALINVPNITATGDVSLTGVAATGNDRATISPTTITIDGLNAGLTNPALAYSRVNVTLAGGVGAELTSLGTTRGGQVDALQIRSDTGAAILRATPSDPVKINSILVESQTGPVLVLNPAGGAASIANPNTVAAKSIVLRERQAGSNIVVTGPLLATGSVLATGDVVQLGTVVVAGTSEDGAGDILIAGTTSASLAAGAAETAVARRTINVTGGAALLGDGTATGGTLALSGSSVTVTRSAVAGDDVILTSRGGLIATNATITTTGAADLQAGNDATGISLVAVGSTTGTGYGAKYGTMLTDDATAGVDTVTSGSLTRLAGANIVATALGTIDFSHATLSAAPGALQRDIHIEATNPVGLATTTAARGLVVASGGLFAPTGTLTAGDDLVLVSTGAIDVRGATLKTIVSSGGGLTNARRADGSLLTSAAGGGTLTALGGSNIALAAGGAIQLGLIQTSGAAPSSLRAFATGAITTTQAIAATGSVVLTGVTVASPFALTAGDDIVAVARGGGATLDGVLTTTGAAASTAALTDLAGGGIALPGESALGRVDGSSILVAATGLASVSNAVTSAGRYSVYGRGGITLGTDALTGPGTAQSAAGDVLLEASIGATPAPASVTLASNMVLTANSDGIETASGSGFIADPLVVRLGNGSLDAGSATLRALRTPTATLGDQGTVQVQPVVADGVKAITIATLDSASADLRALNDVSVTNATVDAGLTLASKAGAVSLATLTVGTGTPLMTPAQVAAIDLKLSGATGATLGTVVTGANLLRDITVATTGGAASITGAASARDDIVVASTTGAASATSLSFAGTASDSEAGSATVAATDADGGALADPYGLTGTTITGLAGRNIVVSGATAATLTTVTTAASDGLGDVRVLTAAGPATLTTVGTGGAGLPARIIVAARSGAATGTTLNASGDIIVDAGSGAATLTTGNAGRDGIVIGGTAAIGSLTAGDDIVAVATAGSLTAGTLISTGVNSGDSIATIARADGTPVPDPVSGGNVGGLTGGNVLALATGDVTVGTATATAAPGATAPGLVRIASKTGTATVTGASATAGDLLITGAAVNATTLSAGRDATVTVGGLATIARLTAGRDVTITAGTATLGTGAGLIAAQRNVLATTSGALVIGTARAGGALTATGGSVLATSLGAGDALTVRATAGDATVTTAASTGRPLLADFSGFDATGVAPGTTRNVAITATGAVALSSGTAVDTLSLTGASARLDLGQANFITVTAGAGGATIAAATAGQDLTVASGGDATVTTASAGRDASITAFKLVTIARLTAGRDLAVTAGTSATLGTGTGLIAAQRNVTLTATRDLTIGTARAGQDLSANGGLSLTATTLGAGDALTARSFDGTVSVTTAASTGRGLLSDYSGFATTGTAGGTTRDILVDGFSGATVGTATAVHNISITGAVVTTATATANTGGTDGDLLVRATLGAATLGSGSGRDIRVVAAAAGSATATTAIATRDLYIDAGAGGTATLTTGTAGRDGIVVGPAVAIGTLTAGDDIVAVASSGALTATTLAATGTNSGDAIATITRANGSAITDPVAGGSVGGMTGGNVVALGSGNVTVTTATATAAPGATVPGLVRLASLGGTTTVTTATATAGDVLLSGVALSGGTVTAGRDATLSATGGDIGLGTVTTGRDLLANSANDIVVGGLSSAGGNAALTAARDISLGATASGDALDTVGNATLTSGRDIVVAQRTSTGAALSATAGGAATLAGTASGTTTTIATQGNLTLTADAAATGALALSSAAGAIAAPNLGGNGITLTAANAGTVTGAATSGGALTATAGSLAFGSVAAAADASLRAAGALAVTGTTITGGALTAISDGGTITTGAVTTGGPATVTATGGNIVLASLNTTGAATLSGQSATVTGAATTTGALTATATNGSLGFGAVTVGGAATLRARTALTVAGLAKAGAALDALSTGGALGFGATQAATTLTLRGATGITVTGGSVAGGTATITADTGPIATGDINAGGDALVTATAGSATLASVGKAAKLTVAAATDATITGAVATSGDTLITATNGTATIGGAVRTANYTVKANNGTIALGAGVVQASSGTITLDSQRLTIGAGTAIVAPKRIQLDVTGNAAGISLGDGTGAAAGTTKYALSKADLRKFQTPVLELAAVGRSVDIGEVDLDGVTAVAGGFAGVTSAFGIRTTGDIRIADRLTFTTPATATTPRVLTLGGAAGGADLDKTTTTANAIKVLAVSGLDNSATGTGGQINASGSIVQLRATYIALGETPSPVVGRPFIDTLLPAAGTPLTSGEARTQFLNNAASTLYLATPPYAKQTPAPQALVKAGTLVLAPGQWALLQNTGPTTTPGGGIEVGTIKFNKVAGSAAADPIIGLFGSIAGKTGIASAISVDANNLDGISPNNIRVNGCVALSTAGCIQSAISIPLINLADPGRTLLISSAPDLALSVELITGATNEALWREDDDDCAAGTDKDRCAAMPAQQRPQRESRP